MIHFLKVGVQVQIQNVLICRISDQSFAMIVVSSKMWKTSSTIFRRYRNIHSFSVTDTDYNLGNFIPYEKVPGPKPFPLIGNNWRLLPFGSLAMQH